MNDRDERYTTRRVGTNGYEIICNGIVVGWTVDAVWAAKVVAGLERDEDSQ